MADALVANGDVQPPDHAIGCSHDVTRTRDGRLSGTDGGTDGWHDHTNVPSNRSMLGRNRITPQVPDAHHSGQNQPSKRTENPHVKDAPQTNTENV